MPASKIPDEGEVKRWIEEGRTYRWIVDEIWSKYNVELRISAIGNFRRRHGIETRIVHDEELIPWHVRPEHDGHILQVYLRKLARQRAGKPQTELDKQRVASFLRRLEERQQVVHYDPNTERGWFLVPREPGDTDVVRKPTLPRPYRKDDEGKL